MKIVFYTNYSLIGSSSRYRIYNYIDKYEKAGIECEVTYFWGDFYLKKIINQKNRLIKLLYLIFYYPYCILKRYLAIFKAISCDIVHIERDFCPGVPPIGEFIISKILKKKILFELDDAVYLSNRPKGKTEKVMKMSKGIIAGNDILAEYSKSYCQNVIVIPTSINIDEYNKCKQQIRKNENKVIIGWIGTLSTMKYLEIVKTVLGNLGKKYDIQLNIICNREVQWNNGLKTNNIEWKLDTYISELCNFDIGIMPLYRNEWEEGKCGFKLIQYMGVGIPLVASPVGVNNELVKHSLNGYLAGNEDEWYTYLEKLIVDEKMRKSMGIMGNKVVYEKYTTTANVPKLIEFLKVLKNV